MPVASNIELAISTLLAHNKPLSVSNVFTSYSIIAGHDISSLSSPNDPNKAFLECVFERALEKHAFRSEDQPGEPADSGDSSRCIRKIDSAVRTVRRQYWYTKLGAVWDGKGELEMCEGCGRMSIVKLDGSREKGGHRHGHSSRKDAPIARDESSATKTKKIKKAGSQTKGTTTSKSKKGRMDDSFTAGPSRIITRP